MSTSKKTFQTLVGHLLVFVQGLVLTPIIIKVAGPKIYGAYILCISYMSIMYGISSMGVGINAKRWLPSTMDMENRAARFFPQFWFQMLSVFSLAIFSVAVYISFVPTQQWLLPGFSVWMVPAYLLTYTLYSQGADYYRYTHRVGVFTVSIVAQPYLYVFLATGIWWTTDVLNIGSLVVSLSVACAAVGVVLCLKIYREIGLQLRLPSRLDLGREIKVGFPLILSYLVEVILAGADRYIIAAVLSIRDVGIYAPAYTLGALVMVLPSVFGVVLPPLISKRIDAGDDAGAKRLSESAARIFLMVSIPYVVGAAFLGKLVLTLYATSEVAEASWPVIPIIAISSIFYGLIRIKSNILFVRLNTGVLFKINLISIILNISLNIVLLEIFGNVIFSAIAALSSYLFSYLFLRQKVAGDPVDFELDSQWLLRVLLCSIGMSLVLFLLTDLLAVPALATVGIGVLIGGSTYTILIFMQSTTRDEFMMLAKALRTR